MYYCEDCGDLLNDEYECEACLKFENDKKEHAKNYETDISRFKWRYSYCSDGFMFCLDGKEYSNLNELKDAINKALSAR